MSVTVQNILDLVSDYAGANTGQADQARQIRQIGTAVEYFQRKGLLPNNEKLNSFYFSDDQFFYACPSDFMEELDVLYNNSAYNTAEREWEFVEYSTLLKRAGAVPVGNKWSFTTINGTNQIVLIGKNLKSGSIIDSMEAVSTWVVQGDASNLEVDNIDFKVGDGCLSFDVSAFSSGLAGINNPSVSLDFESLFQNHGYVKCWVKMPSASIDAIRLRLYTSSTKYWTLTETTTDDGSAFAANTWQKIGWALDDAVETLTPEITDTITKIEIEFDLGAAVTGSNFRVDHIFTSVPDYMDLFYRSKTKGTNSSGTSLSTFTAVTDILGVGELFPDIADLIARRAALNLWPILRNDKEWYQAYQSEMRELKQDVGMRFPRRRTNKYISTSIRR